MNANGSYRKKRLLLSIALVLAAALPAFADKIYLRDGRVLEGKIVREERDKVQIELKFGAQTISRDDIVKIEKLKSPEEQFEEALAAAKTAQELVALGKKAIEDGLDKLAPRAFRRALALDKDNKEAHEALGDRFEDGRWWTAEEWARRPEEVERRQKEEKEALRKKAEEGQSKYKKELAGVDWGDAHIIATKHYVVKCNSTKEVAQRYADFLEKIYAAYDKVFSKYKRYWDKPSTVYIFRTNEEFREYMGVEMGVGGFYMPKSMNPNAFPDRIVCAFHGSFGTSGDTRLVLAHEGTHQMEHIICAGKEETFLVRPPWWTEGLAVYFGDGHKLDKKGNLRIEIPRDRLSVLKRIMREKVVPDEIKLSQFVRWDLRRYQMNAAIAYPYGWSLVYYFLHRGEDKKGQQKPVKIKGKEVDLAKVFEKFFQVVTENPPKGSETEPDYYAEKLDQLLGFSIDDLTEDWKAFVMALELPKLGKVKGKIFESLDAGFTIEKPQDWKWDEEGCQGDEAIRLANDQTTGLARIEVDGNMFNFTPEEAADAIEQNLGAATIDERKEIDVNGFPAIEIDYRATPEEGNPEKRTAEQSYRRVIVTTLRRIYQIVLQCDTEKTEANKEAFEKILGGFKVLKDKDN
jgi:hypothetical protein